ncbi:MAG: glycosyltransferase family 4 protein [Trichloromonadaceae bacterium]
MTAIKKKLSIGEPVHLMQITHDLAIGGLQKVVVNICRNIDREKYKISVLCLRNLGPLADEIAELGIKIILLPQSKNKTDYLSFLKIAKVLSSEKVDLIHTHNTQPFIEGTLGSLISGGKRSIIHTDHSRPFPDKFRYMFAEWLVSHFVYKIVGVSKNTVKNLSKYEKISKKRLVLIENGVDRTKFKYTKKKEQLKKIIGISSDSIVLGVITRLESVKGVDYLIKAMPNVIQNYPNAHLLVVGDGGEMKKLKAEVFNLNICHNVTFLGFRNDIPDILNILDIYILPSISEGLPMGLLEAMAVGCPIIASRVGGVPEILKHKDNALLVEPGRSEELATSIKQLIKSPSLRKRLSAKVSEDFDEKYSVKQMVDKYQELFSKASQ